MLELVFSFSRFVHIAAGAVALLAMWLPLVSRKGARVHRRAGWVYVLGMGVVAATALLMSGIRISDGISGNDRSALFLAYVAVLSGAGTSMGVRVLRTKARTARHTNLWDLGVAAALVAGGVLMAAWAIHLGAVLFGFFAALGTAVGLNQLRYWLRPPTTKAAWLFEHIGSMGGACIGTVTAFLAVNAGRMGLPPDSLWVWVTPSVVGGLIIAGFSARYRMKLSRGRSGGANALFRAA